MLASGGAVLLIVLGALVFWGGHRSAASPEIPVVPSPTDLVVKQPTMFFQLRDDQSLAVGNVLMAVGGPATQGVELQIPSPLLLDAPTGGSLTLAEIAKLPDVNSSANALSDVLGVRIDSTLAMDHLAFAGLVDAVGGVTVAVPADVEVMVVGKDGTKKVLIPKGNRKLDGFAAVAYASYQEPGSLSGPQMARFAVVLDAVLAQLPADQGQIESILNSLGSSANSTVPTAQAATFLVRMRAEIVANQLQNENLQVTAIDTGGVTTVYQVDLAKANKQVTTLLPEALRVPGPNSKVRVLVQNGVGTPGLNAEARSLLVNAGFSFVNGGNNPGGFQPTAKTSIVVPDTTATSLQWGRDVATALKVSPSDIHTPGTAGGQSYADVIVTLGADFAPSATPSPS
jgi:hypothetical protein